MSGEKLIFIAEKENRSNIQRICDLLLGVTDLLSLMLIVLPLYPQTVGGHVYSVNLRRYTETAVYNRAIYWILFLVLIVCGVWKLVQVGINAEKGKRGVTGFSFAVSVATVLYLILAREAYAATVAVLLMLIKGLLVFRYYDRSV